MKKTTIAICALAALTICSCGTQRKAVPAATSADGALAAATEQARELQHQNRVYAELQGKDLQEIITYYMEHPQDSSFLTPVIAGSIVAQTDAYSYREVKGMRSLMEGTPFAQQVEGVYLAKRENEGQIVAESLNAQDAREVTWTEEACAAVRGIVTERASIAAPAVKAALMASDFPATRGEVNHLLAGIQERYFNAQLLDSLSSASISALSRKVNDSRAACYTQAVGDQEAVPATAMLHAARTALGQTPAVTCDLTPLYEIADWNQKKEGGKVAKALTKAAAVGRLIGAARSKAAEEKKEEGVAAFYDAYQRALTAAGDKAAAGMCDAIRKEVKTSGKKFREVVYERF